MSSATSTATAAILAEASVRAAELSTEKVARASADASIATGLSSEVSARIADVDAEESRAMSVEAELSANVSEEVFSLNAAVQKEVSDRVVAIDNEASIRLEADQSLATAVSAEQSRIDVILDGSTVDLDQFAEIVSFVNGIDLENDNALLSAVQSIGSDIDAEESRAISAEGSIVDRVSSDLKNEVGVRQMVDYSLEQLISSEVSRAEEAEASLATELSYEVSYLISNTDLTAIDSFAEVSDAVVAGNESLSTEISSQVDSLTSVDTSLEAQLSSDIDSLADVDNATISLDSATNTIRLKEAIAAPASGIYTFNSNVEVSDTLTVDGVDVMAAISSEVSRAEAAEDSLEVALSTEVSYLIANTDLTSIDSFAEVSDAVSAEVSRAESVEAGLVFKIYINRPRLHGFFQSPDGTNDTFIANVDQQSSIVFLNGLMLTSGEDYTISDISNGKGGGIWSEVVFTSAPAATDKINIYGVEANL